MMNLKTLSEDHFKSTIDSCPGLVILVVTVPWSGNSYMLELTITNLPEAFLKLVSVFKIDFDQSKKIIETFSVRQVPSILFLKHSQLIDQLTGAISGKELLKKIQSLSV
jgi:thioredoxin-like negative regulator of GroEL